MNIPEPKLIFSNTKRAFQEYAKRYNEGKESTEQLKPGHFAQYYTYVRLLQRNIAQANNKAINNDAPESMAIDTDNLPHLYTNNSELAKQMDGGVPSTFVRRFNRLEKAGVVRKINHGPVKNYELILNPYLLLIVDAAGTTARNSIDLEKAKKWGANKVCDSSKIAKRKQNIVSFKELSNKIIIHHKGSATADISSQDTLKDTKKDTKGNSATLPVSQEEKEKKVAAKKEKEVETFADATLKVINERLNIAKIKNEKAKTTTADRMRQKYGFSNEKVNQNLSYAEKMKQKEAEMNTLRFQYAVMMVQMMIDYLLPGIKIFKGEKDRTITYVAQNYFGQCLTFSNIQLTWAGYAERLEEARRFKKVHPNYTPFPYYYFNKNNPKGFDSPSWRTQKNKFEKLKRWQSNQSKLQSALRRIAKEPSRETYQREIQYVKDNIPDLLKAFFSNIYSDYPELANQKTV